MNRVLAGADEAVALIPNGGLVLREIAEGHDLEEVVRATEADLRV